MLIRLAKWATKRAQRTGSVRWLKTSWRLRELASWLRGGTWTAFPDHERRRLEPRTSTTIRFLAPGAPHHPALTEAGRGGTPPSAPAGMIAGGA